MNKTCRFRLFVMMVLEFFIWGAWLPLIFGYLPSLGFSPVQQAWILNAFSFLLRWTIWTVTTVAQMRFSTRDSHM